MEYSQPEGVDAYAVECVLVALTVCVCTLEISFVYVEVIYLFSVFVYGP